MILQLHLLHKRNGSNFDNLFHSLIDCINANSHIPFFREISNWILVCGNQNLALIFHSPVRRGQNTQQLGFNGRFNATTIVTVLSSNG